MSSFDKALARFCYKHPRFGIERLMLYIVGGNVLVFLINAMDRTGTFLSYLYFDPSLVLRGEVWRLISFIFIPSSTQLLWCAISLYFYYFIGSTLEQYWGAGKFTIYYLFGMLMIVLYGFLIYLLGVRQGWLYTYFFDSFYLNMSLFFAFAVLFPETTVLLFFFIPVKIKWLAYVDAALFLYNMIKGMALFPANLVPLVALLNFFLFCGGTLFERVKRQRAYASAAERGFKRSVRQAEYEETNRSYRHKCSVCGKTDTDHPELEFRYCSKCAGYHCFCQEHINNHIHFTE